MRTLEMGRSAGVVAVAATMALAACGNSGSETSSQRSAKAQQTVTVLAAASLTESFKELAAEYEKAHPGTKVELSFAASSTIVQQLSHGAPADVVALADTASATKLPKGVAKGKQWRHFATNQLEIATPSGNPAHVTSLADLSKVGTVVCAKQVPCGRAADAALTKAHVTADVVSYERDVKATLAKITSKDADAGIVYATDVKAAGNKVTGVPIPAGQNVTTTLPIAVWSDSTTARGFVDLVMGAEGHKSLTEKGFGSPN